MKLTLLALPALAAVLTGCGSRDSSDSAMNREDLGTGANTVTRKYLKPASDCWDAAVSAVKSYNLTIDNDRHDKMGGDLVAHRANGERVDVRVQSIDPQSTSVAVRVEPGNRNMANLIHDKIAEKVGPAQSKREGSDPSSLDGIYAADLNRCLDAAEAACRSLALDIGHREVREKAVLVDARRGDSLVARILLDRSSDTTTLIRFTGEEAGEGDSKTLVVRLKAAFDREIAVAGR